MDVNQLAKDLEEIVKHVSVRNAGRHDAIEEHHKQAQEVTDRIWDEFPEVRSGDKNEVYSIVHSLYKNAYFSCVQLFVQQEFSPRWQEATLMREAEDFSLYLNKFPFSIKEKLWEHMKETLRMEGIATDWIESERNFQRNYTLTKIIRQDCHVYCSKRQLRPYPHSFYPLHVIRAQKIREQYDLGICLANGGAYAAYLFNVAGLRIMDVDMKRKGKGAVWNPKKTFKASEIPEKRVLIIENDVLTGRTLRRAVREIQRYHPKMIGVCFMEGEAHCKRRNIPAGISQVYSLQNDDVVPFSLKEEHRVTKELAQRFNVKYNIYRKDT